MTNKCGIQFNRLLVSVKVGKLLGTTRVQLMKYYKPINANHVI